MSNFDLFKRGFLHDADTYYEGPSTTIDGVRVPVGKTQAYRFQGGNAPEIRNVKAGSYGQPGGMEATQIGQELLDPSTVEAIGTDYYGRNLARARTHSGEDYVQAMIREGAMQDMDGTHGLAHLMRQTQYNDESRPDLMRDAVRQQMWDTYPVRNAPTQPYINRGILGTAGSSLARGTDMAQQMLGNAAAGALKQWGPDSWQGTAQGIQNWADRQQYEMAQNPAEIGDTRNIHGVGDLGKYALEAVFENVPQYAPTAAAALSGIGLPAATALGAANSYVMNVGDAYGELRERGVDDFNYAAALGIPMAGLDVVGMSPILKAVAGNPRKLAKNALLGGAVKGFAAEAFTEWPQEEILMQGIAGADPTFDPMSPENRHRALESFVKGGLAGMGGGLDSGDVQSMSQEQTNFGLDTPAQDRMAAGLS